MTKAEHTRRAHLAQTLAALGFTSTEAEQLRRISNTLHRWHELECGTGDDRRDWCIERDEATGTPYLITQIHGRDGTKTYRRKIADRETGARRRLSAILKARNDRRRVMNSGYYGLTPDELDAYIQTDPRGAPLYILRPGDVPEGSDPASCYSRGICVY
jgi:hypothetical protein